MPPIMMNGGGDAANGSPALPPGSWIVGLINARHKYLTAETFGFKINANGVSMKKKQFGNVTCENEEVDETTGRLEISVADDGSGRWALRHAGRGYYLGALNDKVVCEAKVPGDAELWTVHLGARPQVNVRSVGRKRFARLSDTGDEIQVDANVAWGPDTLFTLEFRADSLAYAVHACNDKYLSKDGKLVASIGPECLFSIEFHGGSLALRDRDGLYLGPIGSRAALRTRSSAVTKDELFQLHDSLPQASFCAALNARFVSVKQGKVSLFDHCSL
ncbi:unnamed protein product [Notodromas monacha]|uniref:Fascin-like domain-containing protein n=1 Tax=Notodromas monacha TaxID=399045 RepID=A0A7R9GHF5_9CRUS|nr:unnamed protein product [Notodromas monacha]CAG0920868.1 unnamed protein product [Notodromas monacha]